MATKSVDAGSPAPLSRSLEQSLHRALALANQRRHENATLEHLLLALIDDEDAAAVMRATNADLARLSRDLTAHVESEVENPVSDGSPDSRPSSDIQRVIQRAAIHVQSSRQDEVTAANVLVAMIDERESHAGCLLREQGITRYDATRYICHKIAKAVSHDLAVAQGPEQQSALGQPSGLLAKVQLLNDDYTPMEFVVDVLELPDRRQGGGQRPAPHPFYEWASLRPLDRPRWNFHKYLIGRDGMIAASFACDRAYRPPRHPGDREGADRGCDELRRQHDVCSSARSAGWRRSRNPPCCV